MSRYETLTKTPEDVKSLLKKQYMMMVQCGKTMILIL